MVSKSFETPEISIIIPSYNTENILLNRCVSSILSQSYKSFEVIIVDDGSNEQYRKIYDSIKNRDSRIRVFFKENGGVSSARNYGLQYAVGKYIVFVDADDCLREYFLEESYTIACIENPDIVIGCNIYLSDYNQKFYEKTMERNDYDILENSAIEKLIPYMVGKRLKFQNGKIYIGRGPWCRLIKRKLATMNLFDCSLPICEDIVWNLQVLKKSQKVVCARRGWYIYNDKQEKSATRGYEKNVIVYSEKGLMAVQKNLQLSINEQYRAFGERCLEDISVINSRYLGHIKCELGIVQKHLLRKKIYTEMPWNILNDFKFFKLASRMDKIKWILFRSRVLLIVYELLVKKEK